MNTKEATPIIDTFFGQTPFEAFHGNLTGEQEPCLVHVMESRDAVLAGGTPRRQHISTPAFSTSTQRNKLSPHNPKWAVSWKFCAATYSSSTSATLLV